MAKDLFYQLDLNLLRTFLVLSQELNMRKAAKRLHVTQPAVSQSLQKLRTHFNDELFVKVRTGLEPTPYSIELATAITPHLDGLSTALNSTQEFAPAELTQSIKIALTSPVLSCLAGPLFQRIKQLAPNATIELVSWNHSTYSDIQKGNTFLGVHYDMNHPKDIYTSHLVNLSGQVIVRKNHPVNKKFALPEDFKGYDIVSMIVPGWNDNHSVAEDIMNKRGGASKIGFRTEVISAAIDVTRHSDMYMPHSDLFPLQNYPDLRAISVEVDGSIPQLSVSSYCHTKNRNSPLVKWLQELMQDIFKRQIEAYNKHYLSSK
ncbi:LysR family transcriptional regulator [Vibrio sp. SCSIO 43135]|uniref:LysR family transcriptional regulator n=1 Tax=Vibrio sp. SCSIO 43135 TaxID=2819096 RepID=UPI002074B565|nr:LysR family transcriptional regulator [Vibrio sp. SCSIO 43135]USD40566.1 LysR family transcriptional regulator [Vibrio sp. SCSIO 43135]